MELFDPMSESESVELGSRDDGGGGGRGWGGLCEVGAVEPRVEVRVLIYRDDSGGELR
jgi:hypothetical protein